VGHQNDRFHRGTRPFSFKKPHRAVLEETNPRAKAKEATPQSIKHSRKHNERQKTSDGDRPPQKGRDDITDQGPSKKSNDDNASKQKNE
jgi:hypothetical protein